MDGKTGSNQKQSDTLGRHSNRQSEIMGPGNLTKKRYGYKLSQLQGETNH
jgi:hypothetical protein